MDIPLDRKRNIAVIAHHGAGKTTLSEYILYNARAVDRPGSVDRGDSNLDYEPEEQKRRLTISSSIHHYEWNGCRVNIIDTPGYSNFLADTRSCLRAAGGAVVILSAISGVKSETEIVWRNADEQDVSRIAFVNKMDRERADFLRAIDDMQKVLNARGVAMQMPVGAAGTFKGVIDLMTMKAHIYRDDSSGVFELAEIPQWLKKEASAMRDHLMEAVAEADDSIAEKYLNNAEITPDELKKAVREAALTRKFIPVYLGSAVKNIGVNLLMDAVTLCLPSPIDKGAIRGHIKGTNPKTGMEELREPDVNSPFSAFVFKTIIDPYTGKLSVFRVYSGAIRADAAFYNATRGTREKASHLYLIEGKKTKEISFASAGDIVAAGKLKDTLTGDTLSDIASPIVLPLLPPAFAAISYAIHPKTKADDDKAAFALSRLMEEDPALAFRREEETKEFILSGAGQVHLEVSVEKLKRKYGCEVELKAPRIAYRETIRSRVRVQGRYKKQSGGRGQYGDAWLDISPLPRGKGFEFVDAVTGGAIPRQFIPAVEKGVREAMLSGVLAGFPVVDVKVILYDGTFHSVDSSEIAFKIAASMGFKKGMEDAHPVLLEPVMSMELTVPEENLGAVIADISARRGKIIGASPKAGSQSIKALVPMAEVVAYATDLRGLTGGRGMFSMECSHYEEVPTHLGRKIMDIRKEKNKNQ